MALLAFENVSRRLFFGYILLSFSFSLCAQNATNSKQKRVESIESTIDSLSSRFESIYKKGSAKSTKDGLLEACLMLKKDAALSIPENIELGTLLARLHWSKRQWKLAQIQIEETQKILASTDYRDVESTHILSYLKVYVNYQLNLNHDTVLEEVLKHRERFKDKKGINSLTEGQSIEFIGRLYQDRQEYKKSNDYLFKALAIFEQEGFAMSMAISYAILGANYDLQEYFDLAYEAYNSSVSIEEELEFPNYNSLAGTSFNISLLVGDRLGNYREGIKYAQKAYDFDMKVGGASNPYLALDMNQLSKNYYALGDYSKASAYAEKAVIHSRKYFKNQPSRIAESLRALSSAYAIQGDEKKAIDLAEEALSIINNVVPEEHRWYASGYLHLANVYFQARQFHKAEEFFLATERVSKAINKDLFLIDCYQKLFDIYVIQERFDEIPDLLEKQKAILNSNFVKASYFKRRNELNYLNYYLLINEYEKGLRILNEFRANTEDVASYPEIRIPFAAYKVLYNQDATVKDYRSFIKRYISSRNSFPNQINQILYANTIRPLFEKVMSKLVEDRSKYQREEYQEIMQVFFETNKNSILLNGMQNNSIKSKAGVPKNILERESVLLDSLQLVNRNLYNAKQSKLQDSFYVQQLLSKQIELEKKYELFQLKLGEDYPRIKDLRSLSFDLKTTIDIRERLEENQAIVQYFLGENNWYRYIVTNNNNYITTYKNTEALQTYIIQLLSSITTRKFDRSIAQKLNTILLADLPEEIDELVVISDGILSYLPFETLIEDDSFLVENYTISYAGSIQLLLEQQNLFRENTKAWAGFAPQYESKQLSSNVREVEMIQRITQGNSFVEAEATKERFLSQSGNYDILHLATHTEIDPINPMYNKMLFSEQGKEQSLTAAEVYGLNLKANMVVLSSCQTGFGKLEKGEGIMSMSRAFTYAGVGSTLMTLWKIPDIESSKITTSFYESLDKGLSKNRALQNAKRAYLVQQSDPELREPYYWAGFVLSGDTSPIGANSFASTLPWFLGSIVAVFLAVYYWKRKVA